MYVTPPPPPPSPPPSGAPDPEPRPHAVPLDRSEERSLSGLEHELRRSDPDLDSEMSALATETDASSGRGTGVDRVLQGIAVAVILLVLLPGEWLAGVLSFGLLLGVPLAMALVAARAHRDATTRAGGDRTDGDQGPAGPGPDGDDAGGDRRSG